MAEEKASADAGAAKSQDGYIDPAVDKVRSCLPLKRQFVFGKVSMSTYELLYGMLDVPY